MERPQIASPDAEIEYSAHHTYSYALYPYRSFYVSSPTEKMQKMAFERRSVRRLGGDLIRSANQSERTMAERCGTCVFSSTNLSDSRKQLAVKILLRCREQEPCLES
jgi:hypothetical protein